MRIANPSAPAVQSVQIDVGSLKEIKEKGVPPVVQALGGILLGCAVVAAVVVPVVRALTTTLTNTTMTTLSSTTMTTVTTTSATTTTATTATTSTVTTTSTSTSSTTTTSTSTSTTTSGLNITGSYVENTPVSLTCTSPMRLTIVSAFYGDNSCINCNCGYCTCSAMNVISTARSTCTSLSTCAFTASNGVFGDPCPGYLKYLLLTYFCS